MKLLHIAPHLGGGVGKVHAALCEASSPHIQRHYALLEEPRDIRFTERIKNTGVGITYVPDHESLAKLASEADIVQFEWWNHPRIYGCLCRAGLPAMRTVFWSHISGLYAPYIPTGLFAAADAFMLTSSCSLAAPNMAALPEATRSRINIADSGIGFTGRRRRPSGGPSRPPVAYLGTVNFSKMSPTFFDVIDSVDVRDLTVAIWGATDPFGDVVTRASTMRHTDRARFMGHGSDPESILAEPGIFLYLLQPLHFGTAENALVEAMSLGWAPLVFANPAEAAIVRHGETGFVEKDASSAARRLAWMLENPEAVARIGRRAAAEIAATRTPETLVKRFDRVYRDILSRKKKQRDFSAIFGNTAVDWFLSTRSPDGRAREPLSIARDETASKGSLTHFLACFPDDPSLLALSREPAGANWRKTAGLHAEA